jgi:hypothetical protein
MVGERKIAPFDWLALWILFSAWASLTGWLLSALGWLNPAGMIVSGLLFAGLLLVFRGSLRREGRGMLSRILRSRNVLPKLWLALVLLALVGGIAYAPTNYDYLSYRFPRVLSWSWNHAWYWIPTNNQRQNYSGVGFEWLMMPLFVLFKTDRLFFLINFLSYLLLPGLVFSVFNSLGISRRISYGWMWILPSGYCYILQAASAGNDSFAAVYFLASLHYLFRATASSAFRNLVLSCLAVALMTEAKATNLPLVLPWLVVLFFHRSLFWEKARSFLLLPVVLAVATVSFLPVALLNIHYTGDYTGDPLNRGHMKLTNPVAGLLGNSLQIATDNLTPPVLPHPVNWVPLLPSPIGDFLHRDFPRLELLSGELQIEEEAGLGLGVVLFMALFIGGGIWAHLAKPTLIAARSHQALWVVGAGVFALLVYMAKMGSESTARLIATYYPVLVAAISVGAALDGRVLRLGLFRWVGFLALLSAFPLVILSPARPLFPVQLVGGYMVASHVPQNIVDRFEHVYSTYAVRFNVFADLLGALPPGEPVIGLVQTGNDSEAALWRPFGARRVFAVMPDETREEMNARGIHFVAVSDDALTFDHRTIDELVRQWSATLVMKKSLVLTVQRGPETWYLLRL